MKLKDLQNKHKGEMAFIVCAGPSLHYENVNLLKDYVTIAVNSSVLKIPFCDYFVSDDEGIAKWNYYMEDLKYMNCLCVLYEDKLNKLTSHLPRERVVFFKHKIWYDMFKKKKYPEGLILTKEEPIIGARTSTGTAIHIAYIMGCNPIVLLANDCCYSGTKRYYWQFEGEKKVKTVVKNHVSDFSFPSYVHGKHNADKHCIEFIEYFRELESSIEKQKNSGLDIELVNIEKGAFKLKYNNFCSLEKVIEKYGDKKKCL